MKKFTASVLFTGLITGLTLQVNSQPIITSDGPSGNTSSGSSYSSHNNIIISDGPGTSRSLDSIGAEKAESTSASEPPSTESLISGAAKSEPSSGAVETASAVTPAVTTAESAPGAALEAAAGAERHRSLVHQLGTHAVSNQDPFYVYSDKHNSGNHFAPSGWMGDYRDISLNDASHENPHSGSTCIKITYSAKGDQGNGWAGIYWQAPANNWGDKPGGYDISGKRRLTFWARGARGGEQIAEFKMGGISGENGDTTSAGTGTIVLTRAWKKYTIGLADKDLTNVIGGFCWSASRDANPNGAIFYLDDIRYE